MKRFKFLVGPTLLIVVLCVLSLSAKKPSADPKAEFSTSLVAKEIAVVDPMEVYIYETRKEKLAQSLRDYFENAIRSGEVLGAAISIVKGDSIVFSNGFGKRTFKSKAEVNGETIFRLGSLSKGFTGVLTGSLKKDGIIDWNDKVTDYIPGFQLGNPTNTEKIKLVNILSHTSGTPYHSYTDLIEGGLPMSDIALRFKNVRPISEPGALYSYQNAMFALSDEVVRAATGKTIGEELKERFFEPLGMVTASTDFESINQADNVAYPHRKSRKSWMSLKLTDKYYNAVAAGGINASAEDMAKWMRFLLGHNNEVLGQETLDEIFNPVIEVKGHNKYYQKWKDHISSYYSYGWRIHKFRAKKDDHDQIIIHHGGSVNEYRNEVAMYPEEDLGICVLFNSNTSLAKTVIPDIHNIVQKIFGNTEDGQEFCQVEGSEEKEYSK